MRETAIGLRGIGKEYRIGAQRQRYKTLRESLTSVFAAPIRPFASARSGSSRHATIWALRDVSFEAKRGDVVGIIGPNGAGKSTLLKILARITEPTEGFAEIHGRVGSLLEVGTGFHPELTGGENIYLNGAILGMTRAEINGEFDKIVAFGGFEKFIDTPVKHYSSGMYLRLAFAVAAHVRTEILFVDEVLAVGDAEFQKQCLHKMRRVAEGGKTVLFVSHDLAAILSLCSRCIVLKAGCVAFEGTPEDAVSFYHRLAEPGEAVTPHLLYDKPVAGANSGSFITRLETLDKDGNPKRSLYTWDDIVLRIHYVAAEDIRNGSFIVNVNDFKDQRLIVLDSGRQLPIREGAHYVDCFMPRIPLPAGEFFLGAGMAYSSGQWIWRENRLSTFRVYGRDVLALGRPPVYGRMMCVAAQEWRDGEMVQRIGGTQSWATES